MLPATTETNENIPCADVRVPAPEIDELKLKFLSSKHTNG
jgi:hypothetical protein